jgi:hypothetical protein
MKSAGSILVDAGIMARGQVIRAKSSGMVHQQSPPDFPVAGQARVRRNPPLVSIDKRLDDSIAKFSLHIDRVERDVEFRGYPASHTHCLGRAAPVDNPFALLAP